MNPEIDIKSFQRGKKDVAKHDGTRLVSPPRRLITRYVLPATLLMAFAAVLAYTTRDALTPVIDVQVVQPVFSSGITDEGAMPPGEQPETVPTGRDEIAAQPEAAGGQPLFQAPGWIEPDPFTTLVSSYLPGTLSEVHVREGDTVAAGEVVAELDSVDARIALQKAEANLAVKQAELEAAEEKWKHPIEQQQTVKTSRAEKNRLEAEKLKLQRQYEFQMKLAGISRQLGRSGADSILDAEKAMLEAKVAEATVHEIDAKILSQDAIIEGASQTAELRIDDKSKLALAKAQLQEASAALEEAKVELQRCKIVAPSTGTVMRLHKTPGSMVSSDVPEGTQIISMYDPSSLQVRAEVPLAEAGKIKIGLMADIKVEAMPEQVFIGELTRIVHQADVQRNSLQVKVRILDPVQTLKPEMVARVQFKGMLPPVAITPDEADKQPETTVKASIGQAARGIALYIPASLVPEAPTGEIILWMVSPEMRAIKKKVTLGNAVHGRLREISAGLQPSDKIIVSNTDELKAGSRVRINFDLRGRE